MLTIRFGVQIGFLQLLGGRTVVNMGNMVPSDLLLVPDLDQINLKHFDWCTILTPQFFTHSSSYIAHAI